VTSLGDGIDGFVGNLIDVFLDQLLATWWKNTAPAPAIILRPIVSGASAKEVSTMISSTIACSSLRATATPMCATIFAEDAPASMTPCAREGSRSVTETTALPTGCKCRFRILTHSRKHRRKRTGRFARRALCHGGADGATGVGPGRQLARLQPPPLSGGSLRVARSSPPLHTYSPRRDCGNFRLRDGVQGGPRVVRSVAKARKAMVRVS
jgi:hypothetical protein